MQSDKRSSESLRPQHTVQKNASYLLCAVRALCAFCAVRDLCALCTVRSLGALCAVRSLGALCAVRSLGALSAVRSLGALSAVRDLCSVRLSWDANLLDLWMRRLAGFGLLRWFLGLGGILSRLGGILGRHAKLSEITGLVFQGKTLEMRTTLPTVRARGVRCQTGIAGCHRRCR
jgi:hypothetical protein